MRLPKGNLECFIDGDDRTRSIGLSYVFIAFRHGRLWCYATSGRHVARVAIDATANELTDLEQLLKGKAIDPDKAALLVTKETYKQLRRGNAPIAIEGPAVLGARWTIKQLNKAIHEVDLDINSRAVGMIEDFFSREVDREELGTLGIDPDLLSECHEAIKEEGSPGAVLNVPIRETRPWSMNVRGNKAMLMPLAGTEMPGLEQLRKAAHKVFEDTATADVRDLAALILKTLGQ